VLHATIISIKYIRASDLKDAIDTKQQPAAAPSSAARGQGAAAEQDNPFTRNIWRDMLLGFIVLGVGLKWGILPSTVVLGVGSIVLVAWAWIELRKIDWTLLGIGATSAGFAAVAILTNDPGFVKYRPTFSSAVLAVVYTVLVIMRISPSQRIFGAFYVVPAQNWRVLDIVTIAYTVLRGSLNYWVAAQLSDATWLWYSTFISKGIGMAFGFGCVIYIFRVKIREKEIDEMLPPPERQPKWMQRMGGWFTRMREQEQAAEFGTHRAVATLAYNYAGQAQVRATFDGQPVALQQVRSSGVQQWHEGPVHTTNGPRVLHIHLGTAAMGSEWKLDLSLR
jgi:intracellular septation protein A